MIGCKSKGWSGDVNSQETLGGDLVRGAVPQGVERQTHEHRQRDWGVGSQRQKWTEREC